MQSTSLAGVANSSQAGGKSTLGRSTWRSAGADTVTMEFSDHLLDRDQNSSTLGMTVTQQGLAPPAVPPFRFEPKRTRIDWRMLHSIDVNHIVRDVDLDTLERLVGLVAYGDIEAEDTRHLSETNFLKIFRLSQLVIEYLLYVQDSLQACNTWLQSDRDRLEKYVTAARTRLRELDVHYKASKRELRRARRTVKTYEAMVALGKLPDANSSNVNATGTAQQPQAQQVAEQPAKPSAMELALQQEIQMFADKLTRTQLQLSQMRIDRDEMAGVIKEIDAAVKSKAAVLNSKAGVEQEVKALKEQLGKAQKDNRVLRSEKDDLTTKLDAATSQARALQGEKEALLQEISTRATKEASLSCATTDAATSSPQLSDMLLDAEARNKALVAEVEELQGTVATLQKQLMRAAKDAAKTEPVVPPSPPLMEMQRALTAAEASKNELAQRVAELEQELTDKRQLHTEDVRLMQEELTRMQAQLTDAESKLQQAQAAQAQGGFFKVKEDASNTAMQELQQQLTTSRAEQDLLRSKLAELSTANRQLSDSLSKKDDDLAGAQRQATELQAQLAAVSAGRVKAQVEEFEKAAKFRTTSMPCTLSEDVTIPVHSSLPPGSPIIQRSPAGVDNINNNSFKFAAGSLLAAKPDDKVESQVHITASPMTKATGLLNSKSAPTSPLKAQPFSPAQAAAIKQEVMRHVAGYSPDALAIKVEEDLRILSEHPYEFMEDDESQFRAILPHEVHGAQYAGVLSSQQHTAAELTHARACSESSIMAAINAQVASFGITSDATSLTDREYAAMMLELNRRRETKLVGMDADKRDKLEFLRNALLTHLELSKRHLEVGGLPIPQFSDPVGDMGSHIASLSQMDASLTPGAVLPHPATSSPAVKKSTETALRSSSPAGTEITAARESSVSVDSVAKMQPIALKAVNVPAHASSIGTVSRSLQDCTTQSAAGPLSVASQQNSGSEKVGTVIHSATNNPEPPTVVSHSTNALTMQVQEQASRAAGPQVKIAEPESASTSPDRGPAISRNIKQVLNQSLQRASTGGGLTKNSLVTVHSANALNASIKSAGTGKASVRDYSSDDDDDQESLPNEKLSDEYAVDAAEGEMMDEGLLSDEEQGSSSPAAALPLPSAGWNATASLRGADRVLSPSRLAKASVSQIPATSAATIAIASANTVQQPAPKPGLQYESDISDISDDIPLPSIRPLTMPANPPTVQQGSQQGSQQATTVKVPAGRPRTTLQPQAANSWTTGAVITGVQNAHKDADDDFEAGSIHSFNPNSTTTSIKTLSRPAMPGTAAAMHAGAWNSPNATARSRVSLLQQGEPQAGQWNETIRTIGSSVGDDSQVLHLDGIKDLPVRPAQGPWSSPAGTSSLAAQKISDHALNAHLKHLSRKDSFDTVSDVDFL